MTSFDEIHKDLDHACKHLSEHCSIGDVMQVAGALFIDGTTNYLKRPDVAKWVITELARKHVRPPATTALLVLVEMVERLNALNEASYTLYGMKH